MRSFKAELPKHAKARGYAVAWRLGVKLGLMTSQLKKKGHIRVFGLEHALETIRTGNVIIAGNHPSLPDDFLIASLFWPWYLFNERFFPWSMPDRRLLKLWGVSEKESRRLRCIIVDRSDEGLQSGVTGQGLALAAEVLRNRGVISLHVESGRTFGEGTRNQQLIQGQGGRAIRKISGRVIKLAAETGARILPLYIDMPCAQDAVRKEETFRRLRGEAGNEYLPFSFHFGSLLTLPREIKRGDAQAIEAMRIVLQQRILSA